VTSALDLQGNRDLSAFCDLGGGCDLGKGGWGDLGLYAPPRCSLWRITQGARDRGLSSACVEQRLAQAAP